MSKLLCVTESLTVEVMQKTGREDKGTVSLEKEYDPEDFKQSKRRRRKAQILKQMYLLDTIIDS